jgi:5-methylcytosine-specific restriction endonuclease McrA
MGRPNPRYSNGSLRRKYRARFKAIADPCGICKGRLGPIHYDEPSDAAHPLSFVIDEIRPVSKWKQFGYDSPRAAAEDWNNLQAAHYICNQAKSDKTEADLKAKGPNDIRKKINITDGDW